MSELFQNIEAEALSLPEDERTRLVLKLLESIEPSTLRGSDRVERAWLEEANRRYEAYLSGKETAIPADRVFAELKAEGH